MVVNQKVDFTMVIEMDGSEPKMVFTKVIQMEGSEPKNGFHHGNRNGW